MLTRRRLLPRPTTAAPASPPLRQSSPSASPPTTLPPSPPRTVTSVPTRDSGSLSGVANGQLDHDMSGASDSSDDSSESSDSSGDSSDAFDDSTTDPDDNDDDSQASDSKADGSQSARALYEECQLQLQAHQAHCAEDAHQAEADARAHVAAYSLSDLEPYWRAIEEEEEQLELEHSMRPDPSHTSFAAHWTLSTPRASIAGGSRSRAQSIRVLSTPLRPPPSMPASPNVASSVFDPDLSTIIPVGPGRYVELNGGEEEAEQDEEQDGMGGGGLRLSALGLSAEERVALSRGVQRLRAKLDRMVAEVNREF